MLAETPTTVRRNARSGAVTFATIGVLAGGVVVAAPASAAPPARTAVLTASAASSAGLARQAAVHTAARSRLAAATRRTYAAVGLDRTSVAAGGAVKLTGTVVYGRQVRVRSQPVELQARSGNVWRTVGTQQLSSNGYAVFTVRPTASTTYRLAYPGARPLAGSVSAMTTVSVRVPAKVSSSSTVSTSAVGTSSVASSGRGVQIIAIAASHSGKRYAWGAAGPNAFDCSGFTQYVFRSVGISLPHNANAQKSYGQPVSRAAARPGDLVFFLSGSYAYHVGIYAGGGYMYDAPNAGQRVGKHAIWSSNVTFRRLV